MKGIHLQFQNLITHIQKNIDTKQIIKNKDSFDLFYQKITIQAFKIINFVFQDVLQDFLLKQSFNKLVKQLKTFLTLKPNDQDYQQDDYYQNNSLNQISQFMNDRKSVNQVDSFQRGDIYRFLSQAESKQKDMAQFMSNLNKINLKGSKKYLISTKKLKQTNKNLLIQTQDISMQTQLTMKILDKIQAKLPNIFNMNQKKMLTQQSQSNKVAQTEKQNAQLNIQNQLNQILKQILEQINKAQQLKKLNINVEINDKQKQNKIIQNEKGKKKPLPNKRNSQLNTKKRVSEMNMNKRNSQSNLVKNKNIEHNKNKSIHAPLQKTARLQQNYIPQTSRQTNQNDLQKNLQSIRISQKQDENDKIKKLKQLSKQSLLKVVEEDHNQLFNNQKSNNHIISCISLQKFMQLMPGMNKNEVQKIFNSIQQQLLKNQKKQTIQKQVNTQENYFIQENSNLVKNSRIENILQSDYNLKFKSKSKSKSKSIDCRDVFQNQKSKINIQIPKNQSKSINQSSQVKNLHQFNKQSTNKQLDYNNLNDKKQNKNEQNHQFQKQKQKTNIKNRSINLPQINQKTFKNMQKSLTLQKYQSSKQKSSAEEYLKKLKDPRSLKPVQNFKSSNKQNHSLDMYKAKKDMLTKINKVSQHINLPSLNRNTASKGFMSLHEQMQQKSPYFKKSSKKQFMIQNLQTDSLSQMNEQTFKQFMKKSLKNKNKDFSKDQQIIINQLQRISKQNSTKLNSKNINLYIQFIQSIHHRRCGQKCIHLQRFYDFLNKKKLSNNRKQLTLHKTDINVNTFL